MNEILHPRTLFLLAIAVFITALALRSLRAGRLKERYVLLFVGTGIPFLIFALWPELIVWAERTFQIEKPTLLVLCVSTYFILTTFALLSIVSVQDRKITTLCQEVAMLRTREKAPTMRVMQPDDAGVS
jgi:hypothetical protein